MLNVLISAYACEPNRGSEPGVGWNIACEMAKYHNIWVITRPHKKNVIEAEVAKSSLKNLHFIFFDISVLKSWGGKEGTKQQLHYYLWQVSLLNKARALHKQIGFDLVHHVTYVRYWSPSLIALLGVPFLWGPVGGGESAPNAFRADFSVAGQWYERQRDFVRWLGEHDPNVRRTARKSKMAIATTIDTGNRLNAMGIKQVRVLSQLGLSKHEIAYLAENNMPCGSVIRYISVGNLLHWKGFHLGLRAFALAKLYNAEYYIIGDGPERQRLESLASSLGIACKVRFLGKLSRENVLEQIAKSHVMVHPSLHDSGGFVCLEAMAAGKPVICLDLGGPAVQVTETTGIKIPAKTPGQAVLDIAVAMKRLAEDEVLRDRMGKAGQQRVCQEFSWERKGQVLNSYYAEVAGIRS